MSNSNKHMHDTYLYIVEQKDFECVSFRVIDLYTLSCPVLIHLMNYKPSVHTMHYSLKSP